MSTARVLPEARWSCHHCGACCRAYAIGPVEPEVIERLAAADLGAVWPPAADGFVEHRANGAFLRRVDGHCVFLRDDDRCVVHDLLGPDAKPGACRLFPFHAVADPDGVAVVARAGCAGWHASSTTGEPMAAHADAAVALAPAHRFEPKRVHVAPGLDVDLPTWMEWENDLLAALEAPAPSVEALLVRVRGWVAARGGRVAGPTDGRTARLAAGACFELLIRQLRTVLSGAAPAEAARIVTAAEMLDRLVEAQRALASGPAAVSAASVGYLQLLLRSAVLGKEIHTWGGVAEGVAVWYLGTLFARSGSEPQTPADVSDGLVRWSQHLGNRAVEGSLRLARPALVDLFVSTPEPA